MDQGSSRADRRTSERDTARRRRRIVVAVVVGVLVIAGAAAVVALGGGNGDGGSGHHASGTTAGGSTSIDLQVGDVASDSAGPAASFTAAQAQDLLGVVRTYVDRAVVTPLRTGGAPGDLAAVFDAGTLARVIGPDQAVMTEAGMPKVAGDLTVQAQPVAFVALGDQSGTVVLVTASIDLTVDGRVTGAKAPLHVAQTGDLVLAPDASGAWKVTSYSMSVARSGGGVDTTTTTPATTRASK
jgi:hypothetical protein